MVNEIAQLLRIKPKTVRNRMAAGSFPIPYKKFGKHVLFPRQDVERFLDELPYENWCIRYTTEVILSSLNYRLNRNHLVTTKTKFGDYGIE